MSRRGVNHLYDELDRVIDRRLMEYGTSCAELIGVLEMLKAEKIRQILNHDSEEVE